MALSECNVSPDNPKLVPLSPLRHRTPLCPAPSVRPGRLSEVQKGLSYWPSGFGNTVKNLRGAGFEYGVNVCVPRCPEATVPHCCDPPEPQAPTGAREWFAKLLANKQASKTRGSIGGSDLRFKAHFHAR